MIEWLKKTLARIDFDKIESTVIFVEKTLTTGSSQDKRNMAVKLLNDVIDIPFVPESLEGIVFGWAIDLIVSSFNRYGHDWLSKRP
jgi:hypothetical protein